MQSTCTEEQCARPADARGFCKTHYKAWVTAGRPDDGRWDKPCAYCGVIMKDPRRAQCGAPECARLHTNAAAKAQRESRKARGLPETRMVYSHTCDGCGEAFTTRDKHSTHCSIQCFNLHRPPEDYIKAAATRAERSYPYECRVCGCQGTGGPGRTVCDETLCKYLARGGQPTCDLTRIQCINCADHCYLQYSTQSTCLDPICIYAVTRGSNYSNIYIKTCEWCETSFTTTQPGSVYCSAQCRKRRNNAHSGHNPRPWKRWAKLVYERDNYTCHICNKPTLREWDENNRNMSPSLDHIIPKSLGGPHTPENLRCCHMLCNALRGTDPIDSAEAGNLILE